MMLNTADPITPLMPMSSFAKNTPMMTVANSGAELPAAINVAPATSGDSFSSRAGRQKQAMRIIIAHDRQPEEGEDGHQHVYDQATVLPDVRAHQRLRELFDRGVVHCSSSESSKTSQFQYSYRSYLPTPFHESGREEK
uniref:Uncharacterized protein n=1 Tax=Anopheles farauti TaxID=69004 RepID=A0A182Q322_9DIPT